MPRNNGNMIDDGLQMQINEVNKLQRLIQYRIAKLNGLKQRKLVRNPGLIRPKRYSIDFRFREGDLNPQTRSFIIADRTIFKPVMIESALVAETTTTEGGASFSVLTLPWALSPPTNENGRQDTFDYFWTIRDTGSDREWQNNPQPSVFMLSGQMSPFWLQKRGVLGAGTEVQIEINPFVNRTIQDASPFDNINAYNLHISMSGHEQFLPPV